MNIRQIRNNIALLKENRVKIIYYSGRNRKVIYDGIIYKIYMNVFSLLLSNGNIKCFSYKDVLTKTIKIYK